MRTRTILTQRERVAAAPESWQPQAVVLPREGR